MRAAILLALAACAAPSADDPADAADACAAPSTARAPSQCGPTLDLAPVNAYAGGLAIVAAREDAVALVAGRCTGTWIAAAAGPVVLTAGHCAPRGERVVVAFNVEADPDGDPLVTEGVVIEQADDPDYALIALDQPPAVAPTPLTATPSELLAVIHHPRGGPKVVGEGGFVARCGDASVRYAEIDTLVGSSGAGVLTEAGALLAVHSDGGCRRDGRGNNRGSGAEAIVEASAYLAPGDLATD